MTRPGAVVKWSASVAVGCVFVLFLCTGAFFLLQAPYYFFLGWIHYLVRVVPEVRPDPGTVATAIICLAGVTLGCHWFCRWLWGGLRPDAPPWRWRWTLRVVTVVVLLFAAGTAAVGVVHQTLWLATSKEKLIGGGTREASARIVSSNNMKQIGLATHNHSDTRDFLPVSTFASNGRPMHSWQMALLPFLDDLHPAVKQIDRTKPWDDSINRSAVTTQIKAFLHPAAETWQTPDGYAVSHYAANVLVLGGEKPRKLSDFPEGTSNVIFVGEAVANPRAWADPLNWRDPRLGLGHPQGFGGPKHQKVTQFGMLDGSVRTVDLEELKNLAKDP